MGSYSLPLICIAPEPTKFHNSLTIPIRLRGKIPPMKPLASLPGLIALAFFLFGDLLHADTNAVVVHEWGTFTCLQDEQGRAIGGINVDDEPVPLFVLGASYVHNNGTSASVLRGFGLPPYSHFDKGWRPADHEVTMRLETPVLYFYPPKGAAPQSVPPLEVHVDFHGGILSQYYPYAEPGGWSSNFTTIGLPIISQHIGNIVSSLDWKQVRLGSLVPPVESDDKVWITPREVSAPVLEVQGQVYDHDGAHTVTQAEHFLFYRGIGHLDSPLRLQDGDGAIGVWSQWGGGNDAPPRAWLTEIRADGSCSFHEVTNFKSGSWWRTSSLPTVSKQFAANEFSADNLTKLKASMHDALVKEGLYDDEATAMLKTWELSYFKSPGLRFFYIVPRAWTDKVLPLKITGAPSEITRVMVGRIELISDTQKATLQRLAAGSSPDLDTIVMAARDALAKSNLSDAQKKDFFSGERSLSELGITIPPPVQDYLSLGRFRDALMVREEQQHPSAALAQFIKDNRLEQ